MHIKDLQQLQLKNTHLHCEINWYQLKTSSILHHSKLTG